jgi:hypothetical protein
MSKSREPYDKSKKGNHRDTTGPGGTGKTSENNPENELLKDFDEGRRSFLIKLLISATYVTPAILSFSMSDADARRRRRRPTRKERKKKKKKKKKEW